MNGAHARAAASARPTGVLRPVRLNEWRPLGHRRLKLQGGHTYLCRHCRAPMRVASAHYLPDACAWCGASTWDAAGVCQAPAGCEATRLPDSHTPAFCHVCGWSIWAAVPTRRQVGRGNAA